MFLTRTWRPLSDATGDVRSLQRHVNRLFDEAFSSWPGARAEDGVVASSWVPAVDVFEADDGVKIVAEVPGVQPQDVKISLENNVLTIRGEKKQVAEEKTERVYRYERAYGLFERSFTLPTTVDADKISAAYDAGVLTVVLPTAERARPREIPVTTS